MTPAEAIEVIKLAQAQVEWEYPMDYAAAFDMAISALRAQDVPDFCVVNINSKTQKELDALYRKVAVAPVQVLQSEQRWIPCSERLPKEDDYKSCIECLDGAVWYFTENGTMGLGYYYKSTKEWSTTDDLKTDGKVVAWMPLPELYRAESEE